MTFFRLSRFVTKIPSESDKVPKCCFLGVPLALLSTRVSSSVTGLGWSQDARAPRATLNLARPEEEGCWAEGTTPRGPEPEARGSPNPSTPLWEPSPSRQSGLPDLGSPLEAGPSTRPTRPDSLSDNSPSGSQCHSPPPDQQQQRHLCFSQHGHHLGKAASSESIMIESFVCVVI